MQPLLVSHWEFEGLLVAGDHEHFAHTIQQDGAAAAMGEVTLDLTTELSICIRFNIAREVLS
jgi:hypothetical protein